MKHLLLVAILFSLLFSATYSQEENQENLPTSKYQFNLLQKIDKPNDGLWNRLVRTRKISWGNPDFQFQQTEMSALPRAEFPNNYPFGDNYLTEGVEEAWTNHYGSGMTNFNNVPFAMEADALGNIYVTGSGLSLGEDSDCITAKYGPTGELLWIVRVEYGYGTDIVVDAFGNVYVAGAWGRNDYNYLTVKYNSMGIEQWIQAYYGPAGELDKATSIALDASGNVYVTGSSSGFNTESDYVTIKYNSTGAEQWVRRYNGPGNNSDDARSIVVGPLGNIYVIGSSFGSGTNLDYATIKYSNAGTQQWVARYDGVGTSADYASAIAVDASENVYITGRSLASTGSYAYTTIKYNTSGVQQWIKQYIGTANSGANDIALDGVGNVYVTGSSFDPNTSYDYVTVKYNNAGIQQWFARYNGPANDQDEAKSIAVDASGNVYITGESEGVSTDDDYATIKYNSSGVQEWVVRYNGPGNYWDRANTIRVDVYGNICVTGFSAGSGTLRDYTTIKYNSAGSQQWVARYSSNSLDIGTAVAIDNSGNVYVTGASYSSNSSYDYATIKYNISGVQQWVKRYNGPGNSDDGAVSIAVDAISNVYVTGLSQGSGTENDYATIKYNSSGEELWVKRYNGPGNSDDGAVSIAVDVSGNVYVTGSSWGSGTKTDYATIKYNSSGVQQWLARYNKPDEGTDVANALIVDASGNVYVTGSSGFRAIALVGDYATIKYNTSGVEQWVATYNGPNNSHDEATSIAIDASGNVYVTGLSSGSGTLFDYATIKYNPLGTEQWIQRYNGPGDSHDVAQALTLSSTGNVYITGYSYGGSTSLYDYATIKYNSAGGQEWVKRYNYQDNFNDFANAIAIDFSGNVYVTGLSNQLSTNYDFATVKYNSSGEQQWVARKNGPVNYIDEAHSLAVDAAGNVYVIGYSGDAVNPLNVLGGYSAGYSTYLTVKYIQTPTGVSEIPFASPNDYQLLQNYPNPFNPATTIRFILPNASKVALEVFNILGQQVATLVNETKVAGEYEVHWRPKDLPSGVYIYRLTTEPIASGDSGKFVESRKMVLMK